MSKLEKFIVDPKGQYNHPGKNTKIPNAGGSITMKNVPYPVLGIDDEGNQQMMYPDQEYQFPGNSVYEIPMAQSGGTFNPDIDEFIGFLDELPQAQIGGILNSIHPMLNPYNWEVNDYSNKNNFDQAYESAKKAGDQEFMFNNKRYNTRYAGTPRQEVGRYGVNGQPVDIDNSIRLSKYPSMSMKYMGHIAAENDGNVVDYGPSGNFKSSTQDVEKNYNVYNANKKLFNKVSKNLPIKLDPFKEEKNPNRWTLSTNNCADNVCDAFGIPRSKGIQTPSGAMDKIKKKYPTLDVTGRTYDDYENLYKELQKQPHKKILAQADNLLGIASSPEIQKSGLSKNFISTIQGVLANEGYKLPKSTKQDGSFDGIYGDETKQALADWQSKNKNKKQEGGTFNPDTDEFIGYNDELPQAQEGLEKKGFDSLSESQKALLQKGNNLDKVKGWYEKYPDEMQNYKGFLDQHNADDYLKLYDTEKGKFDESVKNNAEWHKDWYAKRAQLPRFKDVATQRLNNYTDQDLQSTNLIDPVNFAFSRWKNQQKDMLGRVKKNSQTGKWELLPIDADAPPSRFEFPTDKLFGEYEPNSKQVLVNSKLVNQGYYDVNGKLYNQTVSHETDHKQGNDYPQEGTTGHISENNWKNLDNSIENFFEVVGEEGKNPKNNLPVDPLQRIISYGNIVNDSRTRIEGDPYNRDIYQYEPTEVRARLDIWRQYNNIDALKDYSEDEIREIMQKNDKDPNLPRNIKDLYKTIQETPNKLRFIHNNYVSNDKQSPLDKFLPQNDIPKAQKGKQVKPTYLNTPLDRTTGTHSFYDPVINKIYVDPNDPAEALPHEYYHAWQHEVGRDRLINLYPGPLRQPQTPWEPELTADYYNRRKFEENATKSRFVNDNPSFNFVPDDVIYDKYTNPAMYRNPYTLEGEAAQTETAKGRARLKSKGMLPPGIERMYQLKTKKQGGTLHKFQTDGQYNDEYKPIEGTNRRVTPEGVEYPKGTNGIAYNVDIRPGVEIVDNMPENLKGYETMLPIGATEREGERTYDKFLDTYGYRYPKKNQSNRDTVIDLTNQKMAWFPFNTITKDQYSSILGNNYVERERDFNGYAGPGNSEDYAKNWITRMSDPEDTFRNRDYAEEAGSYYHSKDIPAFYGIENGKFKVGNPNEFSESTMIVPVRNGATPYAKVEKEDGIINNKTYTYDKSGNKIWNLNGKDKFIVYSPKTKRSIFRSQQERGSVAESKKILEDFAKQNPDAYIIPMDEGRFNSYMTSQEGLSGEDIKKWNAKAGTILMQYLMNDANKPTKSPSGYGYGYNFGIVKKEGGENLPTYQIGKQVKRKWDLPEGFGGYQKMEPSTTRVAPVVNHVKEAQYRAQAAKDVANPNINDDDFRDKHGYNKHVYQMNNDPKYKAEVEANTKESVKRNGSIDLPSTYMDSKSFTGNPNLNYMIPNGLTGEARKAYEESQMNVVGAALPIPGLQQVGRLPSIGTGVQNLVRAVGPESGLLSKFVRPAESLANPVVNAVDPRFVFNEEAFSRAVREGTGRGRITPTNPDAWMPQSVEFANQFPREAHAHNIFLNSAEVLDGYVPEASKVIPEKPSWILNEPQTNSLQIRSTQIGSPLEKQLSKTGEININSLRAHIGKSEVGKQDKFIIDKVLNEKFPGATKIDYNDFRKAVSDELVDFERSVFIDKNTNHGVGQLGFTGPSRKSVESSIKSNKNEIEKLENLLKNPDEIQPTSWRTKEQLIEDYKVNLAESKISYKQNLEFLDNLPLDNKTIAYGNTSKFGRGKTHMFGEHPENTLGHARTLVTPQEPDIMHILESQSDYWQKLGKIDPNDTENFKSILAEKELEYADDVENLKKIKETKIDPLGNYMADYQIDQFEAIVKQKKIDLDLAKGEFANPQQKQFLGQRHQERLFQENLMYAAQEGKSKMRYPTSETAAKIQKYNKIELGHLTRHEILNNSFEDFIKIKEELSGTKLKQNEIDFSKKLYDDVKAKNGEGLFEFYEPRLQSILRKYDETPQMIKRTLGTEPKIVTDSKGHTWYEVDIPENYKNGKAEIIAFALGGTALGTRKLQTKKTGGSFNPDTDEFIEYSDDLDTYQDKGQFKKSYLSPEQLAGYQKMQPDASSVKAPTPRYQAEKYYKENPAIPKTAMTYNDNRSFYDSHAVIPGRYTENNPQYNELVKRLVYEGKVAYDPTTGVMHRLKEKIDIPEGRAEMATEAYARKPIDERLRTNKAARKNLAMSQMIEMGNSPGFYAPGVIAGAALTGPAALAGLSTAMTAPFSVGATTIPWLTAGDVVGAGFALNGANKLGKDLNSGYYTSNAPTGNKIARGVETGLDLFSLPGAIPATIAGFKGLGQAGKYVANNTNVAQGLRNQVGSALLSRSLRGKLPVEAIPEIQRIDPIGRSSVGVENDFIRNMSADEYDDLVKAIYNQNTNAFDNPLVEFKSSRAATQRVASLKEYWARNAEGKVFKQKFCPPGSECAKSSNAVANKLYTDITGKEFDVAGNAHNAWHLEDQMTRNGALPIQSLGDLKVGDRLLMGNGVNQSTYVPGYTADKSIRHAGTYAGLMEHNNNYYQMLLESGANGPMVLNSIHSPFTGPNSLRKAFRPQQFVGDEFGEALVNKNLRYAFRNKPSVATYSSQNEKVQSILTEAEQHREQIKRMHDLTNDEFDEMLLSLVGVGAQETKLNTALPGSKLAKAKIKLQNILADTGLTKPIKETINAGKRIVNKATAKSSNLPEFPGAAAIEMQSATLAEEAGIPYSQALKIVKSKYQSPPKFRESTVEASKGMFRQKFRTEEAITSNLEDRVVMDEVGHGLSQMGENYKIMKKMYPEATPRQLIDLTTLMWNSPGKAKNRELVEFFIFGKNNPNPSKFNFDYVTKVKKQRNKLIDIQPRSVDDYMEYFRNGEYPEVQYKKGGTFDPNMDEFLGFVD